MTSECSASALARARKVRDGFMHNIILYLHTDDGLMGIAHWSEIPFLLYMTI